MVTVAGFNFTKISGSRDAPITGKLKINNRMAIKDIRQEDIPMGKDKQPAVRVEFAYTSKYEPGYGNVSMEGGLLYLTDAAKVKAIVDEWAKDKKLLEEVQRPIMNPILAKCNIQALNVSKELNLPPQVPLPKVQVNK